MDEYIRKTELLEMLSERLRNTCNGSLSCIQMKRLVESVPAADVAPKSEVAREIFAEIEEVFRLHTEGGYYLNGVWFPERLDLYTGDAIAELKKKYTEGGE